MIRRPPRSTLFPYTTLFRSLGATPARELEPGNVIRIQGSDLDELPSLPSRPHRRCVFELVYFSRPDSTVFHRSVRSEEHTSELQSRLHLVCRLLLEKKNNRADIRCCVQRCATTWLGKPHFWRRQTTTLAHGYT